MVLYKPVTVIFLYKPVTVPVIHNKLQKMSTEAEVGRFLYFDYKLCRADKQRHTQTHSQCHHVNT